MALQALPPSAEAYARSQRVEIQAAVSSALRLWSRMGVDFDASWAVVAPHLMSVTDLAQSRIAAGAQDFIPAVMEDTGQAAAALVDVDTAPLIGVAGDGRPLESLLYGAVTNAKAAVGAGVEPVTALAGQSSWMSMALGTALSDTGRASESLAMGARKVDGYVRMLNPPSCSRCAILAGRWYRSGTAFQRHPMCDCRNIPASESVGRDLTLDVDAYFESLSAAEQNRLFTAAGAQAIREGADIGQVVNARRGMRSAQIAGRDVLITTEGTTRRGYAYRFLKPSGTTARQGETVTRITRTGPESRTVTRTVANRPRLMPETIAQVATDHADYLRLLRANGYLR